jgi:UDP-glucose 4-epimerase
MREAPVSAYSFSKQCATHLSQMMHASFGLPVVVVRPSLAYGPGQHSDMFLPALIDSLLRGAPFAMTRGEQTRDYVYVGDLVEALLRAGVGPGIDGEIINIGSGQATRIADLVQRVEALLDAPGLVQLGVLDYRTGEAMAYSFDVGKAHSALGWLPQTSIDDGLRSTIAWLRAQHDAR